MFAYYIHLSLRQLRAMPVLNGFIALAIALGIGVSMTMMTLYQALSHNPAGDKSSVLFNVQLAAYGAELETWGGHDGLPDQITYQDAKNLRNADLPFKSSPMYAIGEVIEKSTGTKRLSNHYKGRFIDSDFFSMFELEFIYGQPWSSSVDEHPERLIVIDENLNQWAFNGKNSVGETLRVKENQFTVVGVVKEWRPLPQFHHLGSRSAFSRNFDNYFLPFSLVPELELYGQGSINGWKSESIVEFKDFLQSELIWMAYWVELPTKDAVSDYQNFLSAYVSEQQSLGRFTHPQARGRLRDVAEWLSYKAVVNEDNRILVGLSLLFLLVCMVNAVALLLAKFMRKANEAGVRRALGARRIDIFQQFLSDVSVLGGIGGIAGLMLSVLGLWALRVLYPEFQNIAHLDFGMALVTLAVSMGAAIISGIYPAYRVCKAQPSLFLKAQ
ncbi:ABC transporter permease [Marinibactrum halimedae]|uniref:ABC macrolide family export system permease 2 n=1 Tax=Marinibactrum halimedae TaxID=1444977 RepID=A0AA37WP51_9GAMM|nr:ABC transporter permease [Marinibactrum halimedae]MCD9459630.1 ABC transporter permease [Marinibactrum halimedae]GLS25657.1 ABC macrolide family export system permease 2 [Marinibactrum halimedae]